MKLFSRLYGWVMRLARHERAAYYLGLLSIAESSFFPVPPDVMLAPMVLAHPNKAYRFAWITTLCSVLGGMLGYFIGYFAQLSVIGPILENLGYLQDFNIVVGWFERWGLLIVFLAGFTPIPYKLFTIAAGILFMPLWSFLLVSFIGRGLRFYGVAFLVNKGGAKLEEKLIHLIDRIGWAMVFIVALGYGVSRLI